MDKYVDIVYKRHKKTMSFIKKFQKIFKNKDILKKIYSRETFLKMPKIFTSKTQKIGEIGENIACKFLMKQNFVILERNYTKKWGEIDIVAQKEDKIYFIEVKSLNTTGKNNIYRIEENLNYHKTKRLLRTIQTYLLNKKKEKNWQFDLILVYLNLKNKKAQIKTITDIILS